MNIRKVATAALAIGALSVAAAGCAAMQAASGGIASTQSAVGETTSTAKGVEGQAKGIKTDADEHKAEIDALKKKKGDKGGGGGGGGGDGGDPDKDGRRSQAAEAKPNEPITDNLDPAHGDVADWKVFDLGGGRAGRLTVELHWDDENALLNLDVYDALGAQIATASAKEGAQALRTISQVDQPGKTYVKISSKKGATDYTFIVKWGGGGGGGASASAGGGSGGGAAAPAAAPPPPPPPPPAAAGGGGQIPNPAAAAAGGAPPPGGAAPGAAPAAAPAAGGAGGAPAPPADDPTHPRAKIVQNYREGSDLILYLDKGSASGIKSGMTGNIMEGDDKLADGGSIRITKVVDGTHSVAKTPYPKIGKTNKMCVINLVK